MVNGIIRVLMTEMVLLISYVVLKVKQLSLIPRISSILVSSYVITLIHMTGGYLMVSMTIDHGDHEVHHRMNG
jgi:hypothetical protein